MNYPQNPKATRWPSAQAVHSAGVKAREFIEDNTAMTLMLGFVLILLVSIFLRVVAINIEPYLIVMNEKPFQMTGIPIIGWPIDLMILFVTRTGAFLAWGLIFIFEASGILIGINKFVHRAAVQESLEEGVRQSKVLSQTNDRTDKYVRKMTRKAKRLPFAPMYLSFALATIAYFFEILLQLRAYPLVNDPGKLFSKIMAAQWAPINFDNVIRIAWNTIATELILILIYCVWVAYQQSKQGQKL